MYPFSSPPLLGLDIQPHGLKCVELRKNKKNPGFAAEQLVARKLPESAFADGKIRDFDVITSILRDVVKEYEWKGRAAAIHLPANLVRMQKMQIPWGMRDDLILQEIKMQMERDFGVQGGALAIDFHVEACKIKKLSEVYFVVSREEYIRQYVNCINAAGLKVKMVDVDLFALKRLFAKAIGDEDIFAIFCEVNGRVLLVIYDKHEILFHHEEGYKAVEELKKYKIKKLLVYGQQQIKFSGEFVVEYFNPFSAFSFKQKAENLQDYFMACGLAMRELPKW